METYEKPCLISQAHVRGVFPLGVVAALSAAELAGVASAAGLAYGMAASNSKGVSDIIPYRSGLILQ